METLTKPPLHRVEQVNTSRAFKHRLTKRPEFWRTAAPLVAIYRDNDYHLTLESLSAHFGPSVRTVRRLLARAGLESKSSPVNGRTAFASPTWGKVKLAIVDQYQTLPTPAALDEASTYMHYQVAKWIESLAAVNGVNS